METDEASLHPLPLCNHCCLWLLFVVVACQVCKGVSEKSMLENPKTNPKQVTQNLDREYRDGLSGKNLGAS